MSTLKRITKRSEMESAPDQGFAVRLRVEGE